MSSPNGPRLAGLVATNDQTVRFGVQVLGNQGTTGLPGSATRQDRTFSLTERISAVFRAFRFPDGYIPADTDPSTLDDGTSAASSNTTDWHEYFKVDNTRLQVYEDVDEMDETSDEVATAFDTLADSAVNPEDGSERSFELEVEQGPYRDEAETIFRQVTEALDLQMLSFTLARNAIKYGDTFLELVVDETGHLARSKMLPVKTIYRNEDSAGNLMLDVPRYDEHGRCLNDPNTCAYDQREQLNGKLLASFEPWQIVHLRWNRRGTDRYGRSMMRTARIVWKKLKACEEAMVVARLQRAWMRMVHHVDTTGMSDWQAEAALNKYKNRIQRREILDTQSREAPLEVTSDYYISTGYLRNLDGATYVQRQSKIEVLPGDHGALAVMHDIEYLQNKLFASLRVPKAYLGFERDVNSKSTLTTQDIQFARVLRRIQSALSQGYKQIFDFALILAGINPLDVTYTIRWPAILVSDEERDAIIRRLHAEADAVYWQMGAPSTKWFVQQRFGLDDEQWENDLQDAIYDPPSRAKLMPRMPKDAESTGQNTVADALAGAEWNDQGQDQSELVAPDDQYIQQTMPVNINQQMGAPSAVNSIDDDTIAEELRRVYDYAGAGITEALNTERLRSDARRREARRVASRPGLSIPGVHSVHHSYARRGMRGARDDAGNERSGGAPSLSPYASVVQRDASDHLHGFLVDLYARKHTRAQEWAKATRNE